MQALDDPLAEARRLGRLEAERFDLALREAERREREERLSRLALAAEEDDGGWDGAGGGSSAVVQRLERDVERLAAFHNAVVRSKSWRLIQAARRPFGRAW
jgi:hypothetical protein